MKTSKITPSEILQSDIVVIGAGGSGLAATIAAAEAGVKVTVLEKRRIAGGNSVFAEGFFAAESPVQKRLMIYASRDELFTLAMDYSHWTLNPRVVRAFIDKSGDTVRWLEEKGMTINSVPPTYPNQTPVTWHCPDKGGKAVVKLLLQECQRMGVKLLYDTTVKEILTDKNGAVTGILAETKNAKINISTGYVIIATGGYGGNKRLIKKYYPDFTDNIACHGLPHMGDGLKMATKSGAATEGLGILQLAGPWAAGTLKGALNISALAQEPQMLWVNKMGERFTNEATSYQLAESANATLRQPEKISYTLFDESIKQDIYKNGMNKGMGMGGGFNIHVKDIERDIQRQVDKGTMKIANSWTDIAYYIGAEPHILEATVKQYNEFCDHKYDGIFAKEKRYLLPMRTPPFYAIKCNPGFLGTIGGIKINHNMEVLNKEEKVIPGLYAVGVDAGGWESETYNIRLSGSTFGFALNSGRIAGEHAVKKILSG